MNKNFDLYLEWLQTVVDEGGVGENGARIQRLKATVRDGNENAAWLRLELSVVALTMEPLVTACYKLEGKGPCAIIAFDIVKRVESFFEVHHPTLSYPGVRAAMVTCVNALTIIPAINALQFAEPGHIDNLVNARVRSLLNPAIAYFRSRIFDKLAEDIAIYKTMRYANPLAMKRNRQTFTVAEFRANVEALQHFSIAEVEEMVAKIPLYVACFDDIPEHLWEADDMTFSQQFWKLRKHEFPALTKFVIYAFTMISSSAAAERVFSILKRCFLNGQRLALEDYQMLSCMLQINRRNNQA
jgi:hypothetical protein